MFLFAKITVKLLYFIIHHPELMWVYDYNISNIVTISGSSWSEPFYLHTKY